MGQLKTYSKLKKLPILLCAILFSCEAEKRKLEYEKITIDKDLSSNLFDSKEFMLNPLTLKTEYGYDGLLDSTQYLIMSNIRVNNDSLRGMRFTEFIQITSDTLVLNIFETNPTYHQNLMITIVGDTHIMEFDYDYSMPNPTIDPKINRLKQELVLKSLPAKKKGEMIFGKLYFKGICESGCHGEIEIKGEFKVKVE